MSPYVSLALTWILFLALFPMAFIWLRRAWRIAARHDFSEVALRRGVPAPDPARWARFDALINGTAGLVVAGVIVAVLVLGVDYGTWTAVAGSTIWCKVFASFALGWQAHASAPKRPRS